MTKHKLVGGGYRCNKCGKIFRHTSEDVDEKKAKKIYHKRRVYYT